jgi:hypothetical protein
MFESISINNEIPTMHVTDFRCGHENMKIFINQSMTSIQTNK